MKQVNSPPLPLYLKYNFLFETGTNKVCLELAGRCLQPRAEASAYRIQPEIRFYRYLPVTWYTSQNKYQGVRIVHPLIVSLECGNPFIVSPPHDGQYIRSPHTGSSHRSCVLCMRKAITCMRMELGLFRSFNYVH